MASIVAADLVPSNIYIIGAQSTGKSTLVSQLEQHFENLVYQGPPIQKPHILREVAREVLRKNGFTATDITESKERALKLQQLIIDAQCKAENEIDTWYISDRSVLDALVYAQRYGDSDQSLHSEKLKQSLERLRDGVVVLCEPVVEWLVKDGVRLMPETVVDWLDLHRRFCEKLDALEIEYLLLQSNVLDIAERAAFVIECWENKGNGK